MKIKKSALVKDRVFSCGGGGGSTQPTPTPTPTPCSCPYKPTKDVDKEMGW